MSGISGKFLPWQSNRRIHVPHPPIHFHRVLNLSSTSGCPHILPSPHTDLSDPGNQPSVSTAHIFTPHITQLFKAKATAICLWLPFSWLSQRGQTEIFFVHFWGWKPKRKELLLIRLKFFEWLEITHWKFFVKHFTKNASKHCVTEQYFIPIEKWRCEGIENY